MNTIIIDKTTPRPILSDSEIRSIKRTQYLCRKERFNDTKISVTSYAGVIASQDSIIVSKVKELVLKYYNVKFEDVNIRSRKREVSEIRQAFCYWVKRYASLSLKSIGKLVSRDHSTIIHAITTYENIYENHYLFAPTHNKIERELNNFTLKFKQKII
jgi:chromosomal replication initiation ATPase DnaA